MRFERCPSTAQRTRATFWFGLVLTLWLAIGQVHAFDFIWWEAEDYVAATSNWSANWQTTGWWNPPAGSAGEASLSGGKWLNNDAQPHGLWYCTYNVTVARGGDYDLYCRRFWNYGPFNWAFDGGATTYAGTTLPLLDSSPIMNFCSANWIELGSVTLTTGTHTFKFTLTDANSPVGMDCFLLANGPFVANGPVKPGTKLGLHTAGVDWAFEPDADDFPTTAALDMRYLNEAVAGQSGRVTYQDGQFHLGSGELVKFWGTNMGSGAYNIKWLRYQGRRLAKVGVNQVRWFQEIHPKGATSLITDVDDTLIDQCQRSVAAMKESGVYTLVCPYWVMGVAVRSTWNVPGFTGSSNPFGLVFWDPAFKAGYKEWIRQLLTRNSPYTGIPLAQDPALNVFEIQNEDSMFFYTFMNNIPIASQRELGKEYGDFLIAKYGSLAAAQTAWGAGSGIAADATIPPLFLLGDHFSEGIAGFVSAWTMTSNAIPLISAGTEKRSHDQIQFLAEKQRQFNTEITDFLRTTCGYTGLISANVWRAADMLTGQDVERYTYTVDDVIDNHYYVSNNHYNVDGRAGYMVSPGDIYASMTVLKDPRNLPVNYKKPFGLPNIISESTWTQPNRYKTEAPLLVAAYGAMNGLSGFYWFASGGIDYDNSMSKFQVNIPSIMGQFPATALIYRKGLVREAPVVVHEERRLSDMYSKKYPIIAEDSGYDPNRDMTRPGLVTGTAINPLAFLVGRVEVVYGGNPANTTTMSLAGHIDETNKQISTLTGEVALDYNKGILKVDAPRAQGIAGFLDQTAGPVGLTDLTVASSNTYATVVAVALDDLPLASSNRILVQSMTEEHLYEYAETDTTHDWADGKGAVPSKQITSLGRQPWNVVNLRAHISLANPWVQRAVALDANGRITRTLTGQVVNGRYELQLPEDALYVILTGNAPPPNRPPAFASHPIAAPPASLGRAYAASIAAQATDPDTTDTLTFSKADSGTAWLSVAPNGGLSGTPVGSTAGLTTCTVRVTDTGGLFDEAVLEIQVRRPDLPSLWTLF